MWDHKKQSRHQGTHALDSEYPRTNHREWVAAGDHQNNVSSITSAYLGTPAPLIPNLFLLDSDTALAQSQIPSPRYLVNQEDVDVKLTFDLSYYELSDHPEISLPPWGFEGEGNFLVRSWTTETLMTFRR